MLTLYETYIIAVRRQCHIHVVDANRPADKNASSVYGNIGYRIWLLTKRCAYYVCVIYMLSSILHKDRQRVVVLEYVGQCDGTVFQSL